MAGRDDTNRDPLSRAAVKQLLLLGAVCVAGFAALLALLGWLTSLSAVGATALPAIDAATRTITTSVRTEPPQLDSTRANDYSSGFVLGHVIEGLLRYDLHGNPAPGVAERWDIRPNGATFWLREDSVWSDGKPVTAHDFVFAWRKAVDPATASQYAFIMYPVKNGEAINRGDLPLDALGVRAVSDKVLEVELENPIAYFDKLVAWHTYNPIREDFFASRNGRYAADAEDLLFNGPFRLTRWIHSASMRFEKNPTYWNRAAIKLDVIDIPYITRDAVARLNLFQDGRLADVDYLPGEALDQVLQQRWPLHRYAEASMWMVQPNHRPERPTSNFNLRRALQLANDPAELVYKVLKTPSYTVAESLFPIATKGEHGLFLQEHPPQRVRVDIDAARRHLELAKQELGVTELPTLVLLSDDTPAAVTHSEYLQEYLRRQLGLTIRIDRQSFRQRLAKQEAGEFDLLIYGWSPDYDDPLTFADLFASWNTNNHGRYSNPELDAQVRIAQQSLEPSVRVAAFAEVQRVLIEDAAIFMAYERGVMYVQDARLKGVGRRATGVTPDYTTAYIDEDPSPVLVYVLKRLAQGVITIWFIATATFVAMHSVPGNPLSGERMVNAEIRANLEARYGLDRPVLEQYFIYMGNMLRGDFGISYTQQNRRVNDIIREHFPVSAMLGILSLVVATFAGVLWGALTAIYRNRLPDVVIMFLVIVGISVPNFVVAAVSQLVIVSLNSWLGWSLLPVAGWGTVWHMLVPALVLGLTTMAYLTRLMRSSMLEIASADFVRTARAKGLPPTRIFLKHQLRNAVLPVITVLGPQIALITTGGFVVELVFAIPGLGRYFVEAVQQLDYTVIMGTTVFYGAFLVLMVIVVDILYGFIDPRVALE